MPSKSSPLDVLPHSLLKSCALCPRLRASYNHARQPVTAVWEVFCLTQNSAGAFIAEEGRAQQFSASELQADLQSVSRVEGP